MKRTDMLDKMVKCFQQCKIMRYSDEQAMDRVLELQEENNMSPPPDPSTKSELGILCQWEYAGENHE